VSCFDPGIVAVKDNKLFMYESYYNLSADPFQLRPHFGAGYGHKSYKKAESYMLYALNRGEGLLLVTGLPGTGKTSLVRDCSRQYTDRRVRFIELSSGRLGSNDVVYLIAYKLGLIEDDQTPVERLAALETGIRQVIDQGSRVIIVIDEAQSLSDEVFSGWAKKS